MRVFRSAILLAAILLHSGTADAQTQLGERLFFGTSASTLRDTCREGTQTETAKQSYGFCLGFIYAVMIQLQNSKKACTLGPVDITPVIMEALDALAEVKGSALQPEAWEVLEARLVQRFPPC